MAKTTALSFRISDDMKAALEKEAAADDRSVSSLVERVLRGWLRERGHDPEGGHVAAPAAHVPQTADDTMRKLTERRSAAAQGRKSAERAMERAGVKPGQR